jgi:hypothetical protein
MPRVAKDQVAQHELYGMTKVDNSLSMRERIKKRFRPTDTVEVRNITNQECEWQWLDEQDETYTIEDDTNIKITEREDPGLWRLDAGETDVLPGACAYLFIEALYKMVCVMKIGIVLHPLDEREVRNFSFDDPERQEQFIDAVFQGKLTPTMMQKAAIAQLPDSGGSKIIEHLTPLATEKSEWERRQASEQRMVTPPKTVMGEHRDIADLANEFDDGSTLLGRATGGLPTDRQAPPQTENEGDDGSQDDQGQDTTPPKKPEATTPKEPVKPKLNLKAKEPAKVA